MKLDAVAQYDYTYSHDLASKAIGHNGDHMMANTMKLDFGSVRAEHDIASHIKSTCEEVSRYDHSPDCYYEDIEMSIKGAQNEDKHMEASFSSPSSKIGLARKETNIDNENIVTEIRLPDVISCFISKDVACHNVKDICVDDGVHSLEKSSVETNQSEDLSAKSVSNGNYSPTKGTTGDTAEITGRKLTAHGLGSSSVEHNLPVIDVGVVQCSSRHNHSGSNGDYSPSKGMPGDTMDITGSHELNGLESSSVVGENPTPVIDNGVVQCSFGCSVTGGDNSTPVSPSEADIEQLQPLQEFETDPWNVDCILNIMNDQKQSTAPKETNQGTLEDGNSTAKDVPFTVGEVIQSNESNSPANVDVIRLYSGSGVSCQSCCEETKGNTDHQSALIEYISKHEEATLDSAADSARRSFVHLGYGDKNFNGPAIQSGPIASSGHFPYSGSTSLRSESSTASAGSFAFPILPSEWNSSPVKMAKADRRYLGKHRRWRLGLLCCRF